MKTKLHKKSFAAGLAAVVLSTGAFACLSNALFSSCISTEDKTSDTILGQQVLDTAEILTPIPVNFQPPISALSTYVYNDSIAVVWNIELAGKKLVELYNMNSNTLIKDYINVGNGPGEMISSLSCYSSDTLLIWDFMKQNLAVDENTRRVLNSIHCINGAYFDVINNAPDGAYLLYRNRTVGHLPWPPL